MKTNLLVLSTDGSYFSLSQAWLIDLDLLSEEEIETLFEGSDSDRFELGQKFGHDLEEIVKQHQG